MEHKLFVCIGLYSFWLYSFADYRCIGWEWLKRGEVSFNILLT